MKSLNQHTPFFIILLCLTLSACSFHKPQHTQGYQVSFTKPFQNKKLIRQHKWRPDKTSAEPKHQTLTFESYKLRSKTPKIKFDAPSTPDKLVPKQGTIIQNKIKPKKRTKTQPKLINNSPDMKTTIQLSPTIKTKQNPAPRRFFNLTNQRSIAILIGASLLLMAILSGVAFPTVNQLLVPGDSAQTAINVAEQAGPFTGAIVAWAAIFLLDLIVSWAIYKYFKKNQPKLASWTGVLRLVYSAVLGVAISQLFVAKTATVPGQVYQFLSGFTSIWGWGLIAFGIHLVLLGFLFQQESSKRWLHLAIKVALILGGIGYLLEYIGILLVTNPAAFAAAVESVFIVFMIVGELSFAVWMLVKGGKT